jgi:hypothetical protein
MVCCVLPKFYKIVGLVLDLHLASSHLVWIKLYNSIEIKKVNLNLLKSQLTTSLGDREKGQCNLNAAEIFNYSETKLDESYQGENQKNSYNIFSCQIYTQVAEMFDLIFTSFYFSCPSSGRVPKEQ